MKTGIWKMPKKKKVKKIRQTRLRWLGHVERKTDEGVVKRKLKMEVRGHRKSRRPKLRWSNVDVIRKDVKDKLVQREEEKN